MRKHMNRSRLGLALVFAFSALVVATQAGVSDASSLKAPDNFQISSGYCYANQAVSTTSVFWTKYTFPGTTLQHYNLYRDGALWAQPAATATWWSDNAAVGAYHSYVLAAVDAAGHESPRTGHVSGIAKDCAHKSPTIGGLRVAVFLVNRTSTTKAGAASAVFGHASDIYREASWGQTWLTGDVFGPYDIKPNRKCDFDTMFADARHAAGITHNEYDYYAMFGAGCGSEAMFDVGAFIGHPENAAHEIGHVLELSHAKASPCPVAQLNDGTCRFLTGNGSRFDFMGGTHELNAPHKDGLGWLHMGGVSQIAEVTQSGTFTIAPLDVAPKAGTPTLHALKIITGPTTVPSNKLPKLLYVEFRQGSPGVLVNQVAPWSTQSMGLTWFLNYTNFYFRPGAKLTFPRDGTTVTMEVKIVTKDQAVVQFTVPTT